MERSVFHDSDVEIGALEEQVAIPATHTGEPAAGPKVIIVIIIIIMVTQHISTMTKSHHGGEMSLMMKVGMCQCQKPTIHHDEFDFRVQ